MRRFAPQSFEARVALFEQNKNLAFYAVNRWFPLLPANDRDDCVSVAFYGLWKATRSYDPASCFAFSTYAMHAMKSQFIYHGFWRAEKKRQGDDETAHTPRYRPHVVSLDALLRGQSGVGMHHGTATFADIVATDNADPLTILAERDELDEQLAAAWKKYEKLYPAVKVRCRGWGEELAAIYQTEPPALDKRTKAGNALLTAKEAYRG